MGETERTLGERFQEHLADARHNKEKAVGEHFNNDGHTYNDMNVSILERVYDSSVFVRRACEIGWINRLDKCTTKPNGANTKAHLNLL